MAEIEKFYFIIADDGYENVYYVAIDTLTTDPDMEDAPITIEYTQNQSKALVVRENRKEYMKKIVDRINSNEDDLELKATLEEIEEQVG